MDPRRNGLAHAVQEGAHTRGPARVTVEGEGKLLGGHPARMAGQQHQELRLATTETDRARAKAQQTPFAPERVQKR